LHVLEGSIHGAEEPRETSAFNANSLRDVYSGIYMANNGYSKDSANKAITENSADIVSFGDLFISNPDLPERFFFAKCSIKPNRH